MNSQIYLLFLQFNLPFILLHKNDYETTKNEQR